jgi:HPt (histidine-containing phosphotransfer) domain-containing protein
MNEHQTPGGTIIVWIDADLADIIPGYLDNRRQELQLMREAVAAANYEIIRVTGHSMKGSGGGYGFDAITEYGSLLEDAAKQGDADRILEAVGNLEGYLERVEVKYEPTG